MEGIIDELVRFAITFMHTIKDVLPIAVIIFGFQIFVIRKNIPNLKRVLIGFFYVVLGLALFLQGLEDTLFPIGRMMAAQLTNLDFIKHSAESLQQGVTIHWTQYYWVYIFAFTIGFSTTIAEPSLLAVAIKANEVSGGSIGIWGLRIAVALGVAVGMAWVPGALLPACPCIILLLQVILSWLFRPFIHPK